MAYAIHKCMLTYCNAMPGHEPAALNFLCETVADMCKKYPRVMLERNHHNVPLLIEALALPFSKSCPNATPTELRNGKANAMFRALLPYCQPSEAITAKEFAGLLTVPGNNDYSNIHHIIASTGSAVALDLIESCLRDLHKAGTITDSEYARQFTMQANSGYTPLHSAVNRGNISISNKLLEALDDLREKKCLTDSDYVAQLTHCCNGNISLLQTAVHNRQVETYHAIADRIKQLARDKAISRETLVQAFTRPNREDFTPLMTAAYYDGNGQLFKAVFDDLREILTKQELQKHMLMKTNFQWNILHAATYASTKPEHTCNGKAIQTVQDAVLSTFSEGPSPNDDPAARAALTALYHSKTDRHHYPTGYYRPDWVPVPSPHLPRQSDNSSRHR